MDVGLGTLIVTRIIYLIYNFQIKAHMQSMIEQRLHNLTLFTGPY